MARAHHVPGWRWRWRGRGRRGLGDATDWMPLFTASINDAAAVAKVAVTPPPVPTYSAITSPNGFSSIQSYAPIGGANLATSSLLGSPIVLLGGLGLLAIVLLKK